MAFLTVQNLTHVYGSGAPGSKTAINNVSFSLERGKILGIIGHTGSGKSTLVNHLNGLMKPTEGNVYIDGVDIWEDPKNIRKIRSRVGLVFQYPEYQLFEETVYEDIAFGPMNLGVQDDELKRIVLETCNLMQIPAELLNKSPFELSGGQKRRVAIAGVLAMCPEIIVFDEPTAGLDPIGRETIFNAISEYKKRYNATVIIVSHSMEDIAAVTDKVLVMNKGHVVLFDDTREVFSNPSALRKIGLGVPMVTEVFEELKKRFPDLKANPLTVKEAAEAINEYIKLGGGIDA